MAEFQEVMHEMRRMCAHFRPTCNGCPLCLEKGTNEFCGEQPLDIRSDPALVEAAVMSWAAEHPEYPTWGDWFAERGDLIKLWRGIRVCSGHDPGVIGFLYDPIPADIAQKLGIEPKEDA